MHVTSHNGKALTTLDLTVQRVLTPHAMSSFSGVLMAGMFVSILQSEMKVRSLVQGLLQSLPCGHSGGKSGDEGARWLLCRVRKQTAC